MATAPYNSLSSFAGNPLLISPDRLVEDGLLSRGDCAVQAFATSGAFPATPVDYATVSLQAALFRVRLGDLQERCP